MKVQTYEEATLTDLTATAAPAQRYSRQSRCHFVAKRLDAVNGRALECLAHAIEYLEDEQYTCTEEKERAGAEQAIAVLKRLNREIFAALPALPERRSLLRRLTDRWERSEHSQETTLLVQ